MTSLLPRPIVAGVFTRLLVGLDGSAGAEAALSAAIELGRRFKSTILLAAIADIVDLEAPLMGSAGMPGGGDVGAAAVGIAALDATLQARTRELCDAAASRVVEAGLGVEILHASGLVDEELLRLAEQSEALVVGRRGQAHGEAGTLGDVTTRLLRKCPKPVVIAGETPSAFLKPVVAYDGGTTSTNALTLAARYADAAHVALDVVHVSDDEAAAGELLARAGAWLSEQPVSFTTHHLRGRPVDVIPVYLARSGADLLVLGAHGGRKRHTWSLGSHAVPLIKATAVPAIVIR